MKLCKKEELYEQLLKEVDVYNESRLEVINDLPECIEVIPGELKPEGISEALTNVISKIAEDFDIEIDIIIVLLSNTLRSLIQKRNVTSVKEKVAVMLGITHEELEGKIKEYREELLGN